MNQAVSRDLQDYRGGEGMLGMRLFVFSEILLFAGLLCAYAVFRHLHPEVFVFASRFLDKSIGGFSTVMMVVSALTMAVAAWAARPGRVKVLATVLGLTLACSILFLGVKYVEYTHSWREGLLQARDTEILEPLTVAPETARVDSTTEAPAGDPNASLLSAPAASPAGLAPAKSPASVASAATAETSPDVLVFFEIIFVLIGLHGFLLLIGILAMSILLLRIISSGFGSRDAAAVELISLYWLMVVLSWVILFPQLYLTS